MSAPTTQLLVYRFDFPSAFEGQLGGALERIESGGAMRILDALFVAKASDTRELVAVSLAAGAAGTMIGRLLDFRLDDARQRAETRRALQGPAAEATTALAGALAPGTAVAAVLVEHVWVRSLEEAVARIGGREAINRFAPAARIAELHPLITSALAG